MTLTGRKKLYGRGFILPHLSGKKFAAQPGQGNAKDSMRMRMPGDLSIRGIDAVNQSQSRELASLDYVAAKRAILNSWFHGLIQPLAVVNHFGASGQHNLAVVAPFDGYDAAGRVNVNRAVRFSVDNRCDHRCT